MSTDKQGSAPYQSHLSLQAKVRELAPQSINFGRWAIGTPGGVLVGNIIEEGADHYMFHVEFAGATVVSHVLVPFNSISFMAMLGPQNVGPFPDPLLPKEPPRVAAS